MHLPSPSRRSVRPKVAATGARAFEPLEKRQLLSSATISYPNFSSTAGLTDNGFGSNALASSGQLVMTHSQVGEATSVFFNKPVLCDRFTTQFSYRTDPGAGGDGFTFALQENGPPAVGGDGDFLG